MSGCGLEGAFHDLRHTCVNLLLDLRIPPHIVRDIVGHSALAVTMDIYAHARHDREAGHYAVVAVSVAVRHTKRPGGNIPSGAFCW